MANSGRRFGNFCHMSQTCPDHPSSTVALPRPDLVVVDAVLGVDLLHGGRVLQEALAHPPLLLRRGAPLLRLNFLRLRLRPGVVDLLAQAGQELAGHVDDLRQVAEEGADVHRPLLEHLRGVEAERLADIRT